MVSGLMSRMGINMGDDIAAATDEDRQFRSAVRPLEDLLNPYSSNHKKVISSVFALINRKNLTYDTWGWKDPESMVYIDLIEDKLINPYYIMIFRDPMAVVQKELSTGLHTDTIATMELVVSHRYKKMLEFLRRTSRPVMLVSYERSLTNREVLIDGLADFCGIKMTKDILETCRSFIQPNKHPVSLSR